MGVDAITCAGRPSIRSSAGPAGNAPNDDAQAPGAMPCSGRKLAALTTVASPSGAAGRRLERTWASAIHASWRVKWSDDRSRSITSG
ncbi:MAG: hypothetical protein EXQ52_08940 [Bryobacterales bacterium]|nr:hypothetical protein [Bryobacterales bacterium]